MNGLILQEQQQQQQDKEVVMEGELYLIKPKSLKKKKKFHAILNEATQKGKARMELYHNHHPQEEKGASKGGAATLGKLPALMIVGVDVVKVERIETKSNKQTKELPHNGFQISLRDEHYKFLVESAEKCEKWIQSIQKTLIAAGAESGASRQVTNNDLYESVDDGQMFEFPASVDEETRVRLGMAAARGDVRLYVDRDSVTVTSHHLHHTPTQHNNNNNTRVTWKFNEIKKYSWNDEGFMMTVGRKSSVGAGEFTFSTPQGKAITDAVDTLRRNILKQQGLNNGGGRTRQRLPSPAQTDVEGIYSEVSIPEDPWKIFGTSEDSQSTYSEIYSNIQETQNKDEMMIESSDSRRSSSDDHLYKHLMKAQPEHKVEDIYAKVDFSKKKKKKISTRIKLKG